ncbi:glucokinase [bacterium]|nr:glucokinase [bacterium]
MTRSDAIIVGDIGGTNVRLAIAHRIDGRIGIGDVWSGRVADFPAFEDALAVGLADTGVRPDGAAFGLAGPVEGSRVHLLHSGWTVDGSVLAARFGFRRVELANDFAAMARSAPELRDDQWLGVLPGAPRPPTGCSTQVVAGPGTGFGLAWLTRTPAGWSILSGEGGHQRFAPVTAFEFDVAEALRSAGHYVSTELVASGSGFDSVRRACASVLGVADPMLTAAEIGDRAIEGDPFAQQVCRLRARATLSLLGDAVLAGDGRAGAWLAGGVSIHLEPWLREPESLERFLDRGPRRSYLTETPLRLITSGSAALIGAAALYFDRS